MRELLRMQKLDHIRVQVSQKDKLSAIGSGTINNPWFNKTVDASHTSAINLNTLENDLTQDSLMTNKERDGVGSA